MAKNNARLLYIIKILNEQTDDDHPLTAADIISLLDKQGLSIDRKTLYADIKTLQDFGYDIICRKSSQNQYFMGCREFELAELKLLVDAVAASKFIPRKTSDELIGKLAKLTSTYQAASLDRKVYVADRVKSTNTKAMYTVDLLQNAINMKRKVTFQYYEYTPDKKKALKHNGQRYVFSPYEMVWDNDQYYIFGFSESHRKIVKFRVDRVHMPVLTSISSVSKPKGFSAAAFSRKVFRMYDGETCEVELLCDNDLMKVIVDKFGEKVETEIADDSHFRVRTQISTGPPFFGWLFSFAGGIKLLSPQAAIERYREMADKI